MRKAILGAGYATIDIWGLLAIEIILLAAFAFQIILHEAPCPLCLLQRAGFMSIGFGFMFNIRFGRHNRNYGLALLGAIVTAVVATRQVLLHIAPGNAGYGTSVFGLHLYTWALIASIAVAVGIALLLIFVPNAAPDAVARNGSLFGKGVMALFAMVIAANLGFVLLA